MFIVCFSFLFYLENSLLAIKTECDHQQTIFSETTAFIKINSRASSISAQFVRQNRSIKGTLHENKNHFVCFLFFFFVVSQPFGRAVCFLNASGVFHFHCAKIIFTLSVWKYKTENDTKDTKLIFDTMNKKKTKHTYHIPSFHGTFINFSDIFFCKQHSLNQTHTL